MKDNLTRKKLFILFPIQARLKRVMSVTMKWATGLLPRTWRKYWNPDSTDSVAVVNFRQTYNKIPNELNTAYIPAIDKRK
jgi:hypothetical protein